MYSINEQQNGWVQKQTAIYFKHSYVQQKGQKCSLKMKRSSGQLTGMKIDLIYSDLETRTLHQNTETMPPTNGNLISNI